MPEIWILDDDRSIRFVLAEALRDAGYAVRDFDNARSLLNVLAQAKPEVVISDVRMPGMDGLQFLDTIRQRDPNLPVIIMSAYTDMPTTAAAFRGGAFEFLSKPFDLDHALQLVQRALGSTSAATSTPSEGRHATETARANLHPWSRPNPARPEAEAQLIGETPAMRELFRVLGRVAPTELPVLITGETGTGKELVARAVHRHSARAAAPFVALNTAAIPSELLEAELFGFEAGAFTGAQKRSIGRFEQAAGGTLFLDEIGDMPLPLQTRLLRVLAAGEFYRVGGRELIRAAVRIVAATHQDLDAKVARREFRADLLHRLDVVRIPLPALRQRRDDIPRLAQAFLQQTQTAQDPDAKRFDSTAMAALQKHTWPGNVRQLENLCRRLAVMAPGRVITTADLPPEVQAGTGLTTRGMDHALDWTTLLQDWTREQLRNGATQPFDTAQSMFERTMLDAALELSQGNRQLAAKRLGLGRNTITRKLGASRVRRKASPTPDK